MLRRIFGPGRDEITEEWKKYIIRSLMIRILHPVFFGLSNKKGRDVAGYLARMRKVTGAYRFWWWNLKEETTWKTQILMGG
jgi:hypothetical protein